MKKLPFISRRVWVSRLALLLVGFCCLVPSARAADVVWDTGPFCEGCVLTNIIFVSLSEFDSFTNAVAIRIYRAYNCFDGITNGVHSARARLYMADSRLIGAQQDIIDNNGPSSAISEIDSARYYLGTSSPTAFSVSRHLDKIEETAADGLLQLTEVQRSFASGVDTVRAEVATSCATGGVCCCQCPDYTSYLETIITSLGNVENYTEQMYGYIYTMYVWLCDMYDDGSGLGILPLSWSFIDSLSYYLDPLSQDGTFNGYSSAVEIFSQYIAGISSNSWSVARSLYGPLSQPNPFTRSLDSASDPVAHWALDLGTLWQQLLYDGPVNPGGYASGPVQGWRDFALTKNNHPTNTADNALWVRTDSESPLWVAFTNSVKLSSDALIKLDPSVVLDVSVTNFNDFISGLEHANLYVNVTNTVNVRVDTASQKTEFEGMLGDAEEPEEDTIDYEPVDFSSLSSLGSSLSGVFSSYAGMFASIPDDMPQRIFIHEGWELGSIEVPSIWWELDSGKKSGGISRGFSLIRGCFSAVWVVLYLVVIAFFAAIDIFVAGVCLYCCYGLLAGDSKTALHGVRHMFNLLCGFLGFKATFSESP